jgi:hypothetical protein
VAAEVPAGANAPRAKTERALARTAAVLGESARVRKFEKDVFMVGIVVAGEGSTAIESGCRADDRVRARGVVDGDDVVTEQESLL